MIKLPAIKKSYLAATGLVGIAAISAIIGLTHQGSADDSTLIDKVNQQDSQLANHEARIGNTEKDVEALQGSTNTAPATDKTPVPTTQTTATNTATSTTPPEPKTTKTITAAWTNTADIAVPGGGTARKSNCNYTFDNGTSYTPQNMDTVGDSVCLKIGDQVPLSFGI